MEENYKLCQHFDKKKSRLIKTYPKPLFISLCKVLANNARLELFISGTLTVACVYENIRYFLISSYLFPHISRVPLLHETWHLVLTSCSCIKLVLCALLIPFSYRNKSSPQQYIFYKFFSHTLSAPHILTSRSSILVTPHILLRYLITVTSRFIRSCTLVLQIIVSNIFIDISDIRNFVNYTKVI